MDGQDIKNQIEDYGQNSQYRVVPTSYHNHDGINSPKITFKHLLNAPNYFCVATTTNGTTPVNVFGSAGAPFSVTITGVYLIALDATAGNITLSNNGNTVCTIAKGGTAGVLVGAVSLANTAYSAFNSLTVVSSSAGNSTLFMTFTT